MSAEPREHHVVVRKTARYAMLGEPHPGLEEIWFVCHGFGQLARYFIREFTPIAERRRLIVAPEALARFYLGEITGATSATARVGATWMTREDRLSDISDYVAYLDALYNQAFQNLTREKVRVTAFGFSQGAATVSRWAALGTAKLDRLILWGGWLPDEFDAADTVRPLRRLELTMVVGRTDPFATPTTLATERARAKKLSLDAEWVESPAGHVIEPAVLAKIAQ